MFLSDRKTWIPLSECKDGYLYYIHAHNSNVGIYSAEERGFVISRVKFTNNFLFTEYHWDLGADEYGTVKPIKEIEKAPEFKNDAEKLAWLNIKIEQVPNP